MRRPLAGAFSTWLCQNINRERTVGGDSMDDEMSKLFTFLENFDTENEIKIYDDEDKLIFEGKMGDVPQRISNMMSVIRGTVVNMGSYLTLKVKKC